MGDSSTKGISLKDRLIHSSKTSSNNPNVRSINGGPVVSPADNTTNDPLSTFQYSDNDTNDTMISIDRNNTNNDSNNTTNRIQSVPSVNSASQPNMNSQTDIYSAGKKSFAETTSNTSLPKKDQAIVFESIDNIPQIDYIIAISKLTAPKNIKFVSRISNNRFCIFFNEKNTVDLLINNHPSIKLNDHTIIKIRRLINPAKRIIISNVSPAIPNDSIITHLKDHNIQIVSPITHVNAGFNIPELAHILSFRRQVYINPDDFQKLPNSVLVNHENTPHRIFFSDDTLSCYLCKLKGHTSKQCKNPPTEASKNKINESQEFTNYISKSNITEDNNIAYNKPIGLTLSEPMTHSNSNSTSSNTIQSTLLDDPIPTEIIQDDSTFMTPITTNQIKRPALSSTSSSSTPESSSIKSPPQDNISKEIPPTCSNSKPNKTPQPAPKKIKRHKSIENLVLQLDETLEHIKSRFDEIPNKKINFVQFKYIIENTLGVSNPVPVLEPFNITCLEMIEVIELIKPKITIPSLKNRMTRLCNSLLDKALTTEPSQIE